LIITRAYILVYSSPVSKSLKAGDLSVFGLYKRYKVHFAFCVNFQVGSQFLSKISILLFEVKSIDPTIHNATKSN